MAIRGHSLFRKGLPCGNVLGLNSNVKVHNRGLTSDNSSEPSSPISGLSSNEDPTVKTSERQQEKSLPEEPTNCCMSGCTNCVWIKYAEELINSFEGGGDMARQVIIDKVQDPNMKAFLNMELRTMGK